MKRLLCAFIILYFLLTVSLVSGRQVKALSDQLILQLETAQKLADRQDWEQARRLSAQAFQTWENRSFFLHTRLQHNDLDQILLSFHSIEEYLNLEEMDQYAAANAQLTAQLALLAEMELATLENVL